MLHFFRQIRHRLLAKSKFSRYFQYAFGEILLVVIGILIAIQVDNWNEERVRRTKIDQILFELLIELEGNIDRVEGKIRNYQVTDSLSYLVLNRQLTLEDYMKRDNHPRLYNIPDRFELAGLTQNAVDKLAVYRDKFPKEYQGILTHLNQVQGWAGMIELYNSQMIEFSKRYLYHLTDNYSWYGAKIERAANMDYLDYLLNDPYYTNTIKLYRIVAMGNHAMAMVTYRLYAILCYYEIANQLGLEERLGKFNVDTAISDVFLGRWKSADSDTEIEYTLWDGLLHKTTTTKTSTEKNRTLHVLSDKALKEGLLIRTGSWYKDPAVQYTTEIIKNDTLRIVSNTSEAVFYKIH